MSLKKSFFRRKTAETFIRMKFVLNGKGDYRVATTIPFMDHMLSSFAKHGNFDLYVEATGDTDVDHHHLVEDLGISLGECFAKALKTKLGIRRFGTASIPMDEALVHTQVDVSGRPFIVFNIKFNPELKDSFQYSLLEDFFRAFAHTAKITLHVSRAYGKDNHHIAEAAFKSFGVALSQAVKKRYGGKGIPSTKGTL